MKTALVLGCSHAAGTELGTEEFGRQHSFPVLVAQSLGYTVTNLAQPGSSNDSMFRKFLESAQGFDLVLTAWTGVSRSEVYWDNRWRPLLHSRSQSDMSHYEKQWCVYHTHDEVGRLNKIKNIVALNAIAQVPVINFDTHWPVWNFEFGADMIWPFMWQDNFWDWCVRQNRTKLPRGHWDIDAHRDYAELALDRLRSQWPEVLEQ